MGALVLASQKDVANICFNRVCSDDHAFNQLVRITLHQRAVFECARFHLVGVRNEIFGVWRLFPHRHEAPLRPRRKTGSTSPTKVRFLHQFGDLHRCHIKRFSETLIAASTLVLREAYGFFVRPKITAERFFHRSCLLVMRQYFLNLPFVEILI